MVTKFLPFSGIRYTNAAGDASALLAPPYDVISPSDRAELIERSTENSVRLDFPPGKEDPTSYAAAGQLLSSWLRDNVLQVDEQPTFTVMRMTAPQQPDGSAGRATTGVLGALTLEEPGTGDVLPHEQTTPKDKADRLNLIRSTQINTSPIWGLSLSEGLAALLTPVTQTTPDLVGVDDDGVTHEAWIVRSTALNDAITERVSSAPVVIADGHHRFETALAYQRERADSPGPADAILTYIVELSPHELEVRAIHRIVELPEGVNLVDALAAFFQATEVPELRSHTIVDAMKNNGQLAVQQKDRSWMLTPKPEAFSPSISLDSERVRAAIDACSPDATVRFHHDVEHVLNEARTSDNVAGILVRPATVEQIRAVANERSRMPAKTTFFWPKPRTGIVFRSVR